MTRWRITALVLLSWTCCADVPSITHTIPPSLAPGRTTEVTLFGTNLSRAQSIWTSFAAETKLLVGETSAPVFAITLPKESSYGVGAIRLATTEGISSLHLVMLDDMPWTNAARTNINTATAQRLLLPIAVAGFTEELNFSFFKVRARRGQRMTIDVYAQRIGSRLDPCVRVLGSDGNEVAYCDDDPALGRDARVAWTAPRTEDYFIELRDISYRGGIPFRYCMRIGDFPAPTAVFPTTATPGEKTRFKFLTSGEERIAAVQATLGTNATRTFLTVPNAKSKPRTWLPVPHSTLPQTQEQEPNDSTNQAQHLTIPTACHGLFQQNKERDYYQFRAEAGQQLIFRGLTRSFGSPCDVFMELLDNEGKKITETKIAGPDEPSITNKFDKAGDYYLVVEELNYFGGPDLPYRLEIDEAPPGVQLSVATDRVNTTNSATFEINVLATRGDYSGPVELELTGLGGGVTLTNNIIAEKKTNTLLQVNLKEPIKRGTIQHFRLVGQLKAGDKTWMVPVKNTAALRRLLGGVLYPPVEFEGLIGLGTSSTNVIDLIKDDEE